MFGSDRDLRRDRERDYSPRRGTRDRDGQFNTRSYSAYEARKDEYSRLGSSSRPLRDKEEKQFGSHRSERRPERSAGLNYSRDGARSTEERRETREPAEQRRKPSSRSVVSKTVPVDHKEVQNALQIISLAFRASLLNSASFTESFSPFSEPLLSYRNAHSHCVYFLKRACLICASSPPSRSFPISSFYS